MLRGKFLSVIFEFLTNSGRLILVIILFISTSTADAQELGNNSSLGVSPAILEVVLEPGTVSTQSVIIFNNSSFPLPIKSFVRNFLPTEEFTTEQIEKFDASSWFTIEPSDFIIQAGSSKEISVTIDTPEYAEPGGHYSTIYFQPLIPEGLISSGSTFLSSRIGVLNFLVVRGNIVEKAEVRQVKFPKLSIFMPIVFSVEVENLGNVHLLPKTNLVLTNKISGTQINLDIPLGIVLPQTKRTFEVTHVQKYLTGIFDVRVDSTYGTGNAIAGKSAGFFIAIPVLEFSLILISLTLLIYLFILRRDKLRSIVSILINRSIQSSKSKDPANEYFFWKNKK